MRAFTIISLLVIGVWLLPVPETDARFIKAALSRMNLTADTSILSMIAKHQQNKFHELIEHFYQCYDAQIGRKKLNIFADKLATVIRTYFEVHPQYVKVKRGTHINIKRIQHFIKSMLVLAKQIIKCMEDVAHGKKPTVYGLTSLSALSPSEFEEKILMKKTLLGGPGSPSKRQMISEENNNQTLPNPMYNSFKTYPMIDYTNPKQCLPEYLPSFNKPKPKAFNWQNKKIISPVGDQGQCGSCWLFSVRDMVETFYRMENNIQLDDQFKHPKDLHVTEQDALDCSMHGCNGGLPKNALLWFHFIGAPLSNANPYTARWAQNTKCYAHRPVYKIPSFCANIVLPRNNYANGLKTLLMEHGPLVVAIEGSTIQHLRGPFNGVMHHNIDHAIMLVGWNEDYWILKNSWGTDHGLNGYLYLGKEVDSGIDLMINFPTKA